jgi:hypothetical protein
MDSRHQNFVKASGGFEGDSNVYANEESEDNESSYMLPMLGKRNTYEKKTRNLQLPLTL